MSQYKEWSFQIFNKRTNTYVDDSAGKAYVMVAGEPTLVTVKADQQGTSLSQPITLSAGRLTFFTAKSVASVDISVLTASGHAIYAQAVSSSVHRLDIYPENREQTLVVPFLSVTTTAAQGTGYTLVSSMVLNDIHAKVSAVTATSTTGAVLHVGLTDSTQTFLTSLPVSSTGFKQSVNATNGDEIAAIYYGASLAVGVVTGTTATENCWMVRLVAQQAGKELAYSIGATDTNSAGVKGWIMIDYSLLP